MNKAKQLTTTRKETHGDWLEQSSLSQNIKAVFRTGKNWRHLPPHKREALEMISVKISRILSGDLNENDHYDDIGGYAELGKHGHLSPPASAFAENLAKEIIPE